MDPQQETVTKLGLWGLAPFAAGAAGVWLSPWILPRGVAFDLGEMTLLYGAVIVSYLAGIGAGGILGSDQRSARHILPSMIVVLVAWVVVWPVGAMSINLPDVARYLVMIGALAYLWMRDMRAVEMGQLPGWYGALRTRLTFWACLALGLIISRLLI